MPGAVRDALHGNHAIWCAKFLLLIRRTFRTNDALYGKRAPGVCVTCHYGNSAPLQNPEFDQLGGA